MTLHEFFSFEIIEKYTSIGLTIDGTKGGLLIGPSHEYEGIKTLMRYADGYRLIAELEGGEFILNAGATKYFMDKLILINQYDIDIDFAPIISTNLKGITLINCFADNKENGSKFLLLDARGKQFTINSRSTSRHIKELEYMNNAIGFEYNKPPIIWT